MESVVAHTHNSRMQKNHNAYLKNKHQWDGLQEAGYVEKHIYKLMLIKNIDSLLRFTRKLKTGQSGVSAFV